MAVAHAVYEHAPIRYKDLSDMLDFSPTILSQKLSQLAELGIITRHQNEGSKEVLYKPSTITKKMVKAYHILEEIDDELSKRHKVR